MTPPLSRDAAMVLGMAGTALPFARTREEQAERWLRLLRLHGHVAGALQSVGVGEAPLERPHKPVSSPGLAHEGQDSDAVDRVAADAARLASERAAASIATEDVLGAVMHVYGEDFDRVLRAYGTDRDEVLARMERSDTAHNH